MKTILLLGGFGFIGTNIIKFIDDNFLDEYSVIVFDRLDYHPYGITFRSVSKVYSGDFTDKLFLKSIFKENQIDIVIHSLSTTVPAFSENVCFDIDTNLKPTVELLTLMNKYCVRKIVFVSSGGAIYGNEAGSALHCEDEDVYPRSSYGIIKLTIEKYLFQFYHLYGIEPLILRLSNPYGPYHYSQKQGIINVALDHAISERLFHVWGDGFAKKDYIYINDFCKILFDLLGYNIYGTVLNVGSGVIRSINDILTDIKMIIPDFKWEYGKANKLDVNHFELDISKLNKNIGNIEFTPFSKGILETYNWIKYNKNELI